MPQADTQLTERGGRAVPGTAPAMTERAAGCNYRFACFELQPHERRLLVAGEPAAVGPHAFDLLIAMDRSNRDALLRLAPDGEGRDRVRLLREFGGSAEPDVPDPYYGGEEGFADVLEIVDRWLGPDYRHFRVSASDGDTYILRHDGRDGEWDLAAFRRGL